jgi:hypothetical protein
MDVTKVITICALVVELTCSFPGVSRGQQASPVQPPAPGMITESSQDSAAGPPESDVAKANNPLSPMNAIYFQNYYAPTVYGVRGPDNLLDIRSIFISGRQIIRATLPILSSDVCNGDQVSGLGDFTIFDAFRVSSEKSRNVLAVGPLVVAPTATNRFLGQGKWQAGLAGVGVRSLSEGSLLIGILTWQHAFAGEHSRPDAQVVTFQPITTLSVGRGYYVRSSGIWSFDISDHKNLIPVGIGFGKVFKSGNVIVNAFIEPQFTVYHYGTALPSIQLYTGLHFLFRKKTD